MRQGTFKFRAMGVVIKAPYPTTFITLKYTAVNSKNGPGYTMHLTAPSFTALRDAVILAEGSLDTATATRVLKVIDKTAQLLADWATASKSTPEQPTLDQKVAALSSLVKQLIWMPPRETYSESKNLEQEREAIQCIRRILEVPDV